MLLGPSWLQAWRFCHQHRQGPQGLPSLLKPPRASDLPGPPRRSYRRKGTRTDTGCLLQVPNHHQRRRHLDGVLRARPCEGYFSYSRNCQQGPSPRPAIVKIAAKQTAQTRPLLEQLDPRRCAQATSAGCEIFCDFSREPGAVAALARHLPLVQSRCVQGCNFWPSTQNCPNPEKLWIARKDLAQEALDIRTWKGDHAAATYVGKMPKSARQQHSPERLAAASSMAWRSMRSGKKLGACTTKLCARTGV